jgi:hypothetical protein
MSRLSPLRGILGASLLLLFIGGFSAMGQEATTGGDTQKVPCPSGPKSIGFDATMPKVAAGSTAEVSFTIKDGKGNAAVKVKLKPNPDNPDAWDVFIAFGDGEFSMVAGNVTPGMLTSFKVVITDDAVAFRMGPEGEPASFTTVGPAPQGFDLSADSVNLDVVWSFPSGTNLGNNPANVSTPSGNPASDADASLQNAINQFRQDREVSPP